MDSECWGFNMPSSKPPHGRKGKAEPRAYVQTKSKTSPKIRCRLRRPPQPQHSQRPPDANQETVAQGPAPDFPDYSDQDLHERAVRLQFLGKRSHNLSFLLHFDAPTRSKPSFFYKGLNFFTGLISLLGWSSFLVVYMLSSLFLHLSTTLQSLLVPLHPGFRWLMSYLALVSYLPLWRLPHL